MPEHTDLPERRDQPTPRPYIFSEAQTRLFFVGSMVLMSAALIGILLLASWRPQGRFFEPDRTQLLQTLERASTRLEGGEVNADGSSTIPIEHAMELVVERGVASPFTAVAGQAAGDASAQAEAGEDAADGAASYSTNCAACHQANGAGIPGAFPPLALHLPQLYNAQGGRSYLINVVLYGLQGELEIEGTSYNGVMPSFAQLSDEEVAATLNHELSSWENEALLEAFEPILPEDVAQQRQEQKSSAEVRDLRPTLP